MGIKFSQFGAATTPTQNDVVVGLQNGTNRKFSLGALLAWIKGQITPGDIGAVPETRKINTKALSSDISLTAADVSAIPASEKGAASGVATLDATGKVPASQLNLSGKQDEITASGILKGDGAGGVSAATAGTDYQAPLTFDTTPTAGSANPVTSEGIDAAIKARYSSTTLYTTLTNVSSDTTITMGDDFTNFKWLMIIFNTRSPASANYRMPLVISTNSIPQGGFYPIINSEANGYVRINYISGQTKQLRIQATNLSALYIANIYGLT